VQDGQSTIARIKHAYWPGFFGKHCYQELFQLCTDGRTYVFAHSRIKIWGGIVICIKDEKEFIEENLELLETVFIVSDLEVVDSAHENFTDAEEIEKLKIKITHADGEKCERCWKYDKLGSDSEHPTLCPRCTAVLK